MTDDKEEFTPPVDIIVDPPGYQSTRHEAITAIKYGYPGSCDCKLVPQYGGAYITNPAFIRVAEDDPHGRSLQATQGGNNDE